ncbi:protoheme IX farnesyltransferase [Aggregicoccus sp. 17bor-14]|uniref:heme o synthase n=1 Tax=Myxococcaceae TaxID=31 RepID=UPI0012EF8975|nr:protoheme IX farnesyltransferase [Simulacricoccus sp. 17bor-14]MRI88473.1 protoheme IX farnesyltransferase [Aggregicoccus sp. 17bor-14]
MSTRALSLSTTTADLVSLTKPRLSSLVLATTAGGMWLAPGGMSLARMLVAMIATAGTVGAANAFNCFIERDSDRYMRRTASRPLPSGRMEPAVALWFGLSLAAISLPSLWLAANLLTAALGLLALLSYVLLYTPLKARTSAAMLVGAVPGALPPLMGWTAVTGQVDAGGYALFAILFLWQIPHFIAIALFRKEEYAAAGLTSLPLERGDESSRLQLLLYTLALVPTTLLPYQLHIAGVWYLGAALVLGAGFLGIAAWGFFRRLDKPWARQTFFFSLLYLTGLFAALMLDRTTV